METSSLSDGTGTGTFFIIESMEDSEAKDKSIELFERCREFLKKNKILEEENARLRKQLRNQAMLMDQNILVNDKRLRSYKNRAQNAEIRMKEASSKLKIHSNQRTSIPMMKMVADTLRSIADDLITEDNEVGIVFGNDIVRREASPSTSSLPQEQHKRRRSTGNETQPKHHTGQLLNAGRNRDSIGQIPRTGLGSSSSKKMRIKEV
jgi:hypothetical protein